MAAILTNGPWPFVQIFIPLSQKAPHESWRKLAQGFQRISLSNMWANVQTGGETTDGKWSQQIILSLGLRWANTSVGLNRVYRYQIFTLGLNDVNVQQNANSVQQTKTCKLNYHCDGTRVRVYEKHLRQFEPKVKKTTSWTDEAKIRLFSGRQFTRNV